MPKSQEKNVFYHFKMVSIRNEKIQEWFVQVEVGSIEYYISFEYSVQKKCRVWSIIFWWQQCRSWETKEDKTDQDSIKNFKSYKIIMSNWHV